MRESSAPVQGALQLCDWLIKHGSHPELLSLCNATLHSNSTEQVERLLPGLPACIPAPAPAPALLHSLPPRSLALEKVLACFLFLCLHNLLLTDPILPVLLVGMLST